MLRSGNGLYIIELVEFRFCVKHTPVHEIRNMNSAVKLTENVRRSRKTVKSRTAAYPRYIFPACSDTSELGRFRKKNKVALYCYINTLMMNQ